MTEIKEEEDKTTIYKEQVDDMFNVVISDIATTRIKFLCAKVPTRQEWSGVMFYKVTGPGISNLKETTVEILDILALNIGNSVFTKYESDEPRLLEYILNYPELTEEGVYRGHIHSHHEMATNFSGTDISELIESAEYFNVFVSLIVNNVGSYSIGFSTMTKSKERVNTINKLVNWDGIQVEEQAMSADTYDVVRFNWAPITDINKLEPGNEFINSVDNLVSNYNSKSKEAIQKDLFGVSSIPNSTVIANSAHTKEYDLKQAICRIVACSLYSLTASVDTAAWNIPTGISIKDYTENVTAMIDLIMMQLGNPIEPSELIDIYSAWEELLGDYKGAKREYILALLEIIQSYKKDELKHSNNGK